MKNSFLYKYRYYKYLLFILPGFIIWFVLAVYPNIEVFPLSLYRWNGISKAKIYLGLQNFDTVLSNPNFKISFINTVFYVIFLFVIQTIIAVLLSIILKENTAHNRFFRTLFFLPLVFSSVMVGLTWGYMYDPNLGVLNQLLPKLGLQGFNNFNWLGEPVRAIFFIVLVHIWASIGFPITIITAGLQTIPETLYEAINVEGASSMQTFSYLTFPLLLPTLLRVTLLTVISGAKAFDYVFLMGSTLSDSPFDTWSVYIYRSLQNQNLGLPAAIGVLLGIILFVIFLIQYVITKRVEESVN